MTRAALIVSSIVGLALAVAEGVILPYTISIDPGVTGLGLLVGILGALAGGVAGRLILGRRRAHNYYKLSLPVLCAVAGFALVSAVTSWLITHDVVFGPAPSGIPASVLVAGIIGIVVYLGAAFVYGFAGTKQGVGVGARIGLLVLLLASVLPYVNVLGFLGWIVVFAVQKPAAAAGPSEPVAASQELPAASE